MYLLRQSHKRKPQPKNLRIWRLEEREREGQRQQTSCFSASSLVLVLGLSVSPVYFGGSESVYHTHYPDCTQIKMVMVETEVLQTATTWTNFQMGKEDCGLAKIKSLSETPVLNEKGDQTQSIAGGLGEGKTVPDDDDFDPSAPPPFKIAEIRAAIPKHCWVKDPWRSLSYVLRDVVAVFGLAAAAIYFNNWVFWLLYWPIQGTMFWAIFVLGHDCGHGSFSDYPLLNEVVGLILHSSILVPYHGWRISHRTHHQNHGHVENDESWVPLSERLYKTLGDATKVLRYKVPFPMFAYPIYLWKRSPGKKGSHFNPYSDLFPPGERKNIVVSTLCWTLMAALLICLSMNFGPIQIFKIYGVPYVVFVMWLDFVTYLHHHGHEEKLPWYRGKEWSYLRGGLTTVDRDYGLFNNIHHDIGTHVIHHLFPQIPHYHLVEATKGAKPVLGKYYREPKRSGPLPLHLMSNLKRSITEDHFVSDTGDVVFYQTDPKLYQPSSNKEE